MAEFKMAFQKMLNHEGNYSKDPDDLGGETYKGISRSAHSQWQGWNRLDKYKNKKGFPSTLDKDFELQKEIEQFYARSFWSPINADKIQSQTLANSIFDFAVNAGIKTSVQLVQSIIGTDADGIMGTQTLKELNTFNPKHFHANFTISKITHYITIIKKRPANKKYLYGWITRALEYHE